MVYNTKNVRDKAARDAIPPQKKSRTRAESMRDLRAERKRKGWVSARFDCTPDEKRRLQICLDRLRKVKP